MMYFRFLNSHYHQRRALLSILALFVVIVICLSNQVGIASACPSPEAVSMMQSDGSEPAGDCDLTDQLVPVDSIVDLLVIPVLFLVVLLLVWQARVIWNYCSSHDPPSRRTHLIHCVFRE